MKFLRTCFYLMISLSGLAGQTQFSPPPLELVTVPTAGNLPKGSYNLELLLENSGGVLPELTVGLSDNFTIGLSFGIQNFIGAEKIELNKPTPEVMLKYRIFVENEHHPALLIGLDTQGRGDYHDEDDAQRYDQKAWGFYLVTSKNWNFLGDLGLHLGVAKNTWENEDGDDDFNLFFGLDKSLNRDFTLLAEYDAALNDNNDEYELDGLTFGRGRGYLNAGLRWGVTSNMKIELNLNNINLNNHNADYATREIKIIYSEYF